jgi:hypothetical protein
MQKIRASDRSLASYAFHSTRHGGWQALRSSDFRQEKAPAGLQLHAVEGL